mgnify:CR=1 FL=1
MRRLIAVILMLLLSTATAFALGTEDECRKEIQLIISNQNTPKNYDKLPYVKHTSAQNALSSWLNGSGPRYITAITEKISMELRKLKNSGGTPLQRQVTTYRIYFTPESLAKFRR